MSIPDDQVVEDEDLAEDQEEDENELVVLDPSHVRFST